MASTTRDVYLVIGGSGFLGRHIVMGLLERGDAVSVLDIVQRYHDVPFYSGDISEEEQVASALRKSGATCIIHTASPPHGMDDPALYWKVNVDGTKSIIDAAVACGVKKLVYTSSAGVNFVGDALIDIDERVPIPEKAMDAYNESKAKAEQLVLSSNDKGGLLTVALRPSGIFGPGDRQVMHGFYQVFQHGQTHFQIGDNTNLFDWTYVGNVAYAHLLAADKLVPPQPLDSGKVKEMLKQPLPPINLTAPAKHIPTSVCRPLGPYVVPPEDAFTLIANWENPDYKPPAERPVIRGRFDPFCDAALARADVPPTQVAGQAFFITNGEPLYFWDVARFIWRQLEQRIGPENTRRRIVFPRQFGMILAAGAEWWGWLSGKQPAFTRFRVKFSCEPRWHNIEKARRVLGYEPQVGLEDGMNRMIDWFIEDLQSQQAAKSGKA